MQNEPNNIAEDENVDPVVKAHSADVVFMAGALRAAKNSPPAIREKILADLQDHVDYDASELAFLFDGETDHNDHALYDFPDSERRRKIIRDNRLDAAE